jgi:membrane protein YdbS with pleckstrin-like domain
MAHAQPPGAAPGHGASGHAAHNHPTVPHLHIPHEPRKPPRRARVAQGETVYGFYHRHPIVFIRGLRYPLIPILLVLVLIVVTNAINPSDVPDWLATGLLISNGLLLIFIGLIGLWLIYIFFDWQADYLLITDRRVVVNVETPGVKTLLREVPMGKVQNVISKTAHLNHPLQKALRIGTLIIDTAGMGQITFEDVHETDSNKARAVMMDLQKGVKQATQLPRDQYRRQVVHSLIQGSAPPPAPRQIEIKSHARRGYGFWNSFLPFKPQYEGMQIVWHRHWWFLLQEERGPLGLLFLILLTILALKIASNGFGLTDSSMPVLATTVGGVALVLVVLPWAVWQWENWRNDKYIVTKDSLRSVDTLPFGFDETVKQTELRRVVDATVRIEGITAKLFRFGDVVMKTPGEATEFRFNGVPNPFDVHQEIMLRLEAQREQEQAQWDRDIQEWLRAYVDERRAEPPPRFTAPPGDDPWTIW